MTYVVTENCIACKYTDCVEVCPVDCFYEGENMLVIHPDECIDCGVCEPECPVDAIKPDTEPDMERWVEFNRKYSEMWPVLVTKRDALPDPDLGFSFFPEYWSQGYALESALAVMRHAREALGLGRIVAITTPDNEPSIRLLGKLGFRFDRMVTLGGEELRHFVCEP